MAKVTVENTQTQNISTVGPWYEVALVGAMLGVLLWGLTELLNRFIITAIFCQSTADTINMCANTYSISGNVSTVLIAVIGMFALVRFKTPRPMLVALAMAVALWGLADWTRGLGWVEIIAWNMLLYVLGYSLFAKIVRYEKLVPVLIIVLVVLAIIRVLTTL